VTYLIGKIFVYLLIALAMGAAAGWLWRNLQAVDREARLERQLNDLRSRLPQLETALRGRDQHLEVAQAELRFREEALADLDRVTAQRDALQAEVERLRTATVVAPSSVPPAASEDGETPVVDAMDLQSANPQETPDNTALAAAREELEHAQKALRAEQRQVAELTRERELQNRALRALEQQLEMAREGYDQAASG
jgi:hypothetical protein